KSDCSQRVAVVTGANQGVGLAIVRSLCRQFQGDVYLTTQDQAMGQQAVEDLQREGLQPLFHQLDITDRSSIRILRSTMLQEYGGIDVLVNNAGIAFKVADTTPFEVQAEVTIATNFFATRDVCSELLPTIKRRGRVVNMSSVISVSVLQKCGSELQSRFRSETLTENELVELMTKFVEDTKKGIHSEQGWPSTAYGISKIGITVLSKIHARILSRDRPADGILLNACCPGWVRPQSTGQKAARSLDEGAETPVYLALLPPDVTEPHGQLVSAKKVQMW
uniref:carbonyl reductase (NADPH) n=1 Tax=Callorhinchus milii TaxID=7868 RepID=A0A4W3JKI5_CALMI